MKILVDMNLSPDWCAALARHGHEAVHWSTIGPINAPDAEIMQYARDTDSVVFTHDLDFGAILAATGANTPSVLQVRGQDVMPDALEVAVSAALIQFATELESGALVTVDIVRARVRILPV